MSVIQVIIGGLPYILLSSGQDMRKTKGGKRTPRQEGKLMDPAKEFFSVIMPD